VSTTLVANLPPVSTTLAANFATNTTGVVDTGDKFATGVNNASGKFAASVNDTGGKLPPVLITPVANNQYQAADTLHWTWRQKFCIYVNSTTRRFQNKIIKIFMIDDFFYLPLVSMTPVVQLKLQLSSQILEKNLNGPESQKSSGTTL
jgi:hypothetical protein